MSLMVRTRYSEDIKGDQGNFNWSACFDLTGGYLGISQSQGGELKDRVLLSPKQVEELVAFVQSKKARR